jgi:hypothetical protein
MWRLVNHCLATGMFTEQFSSNSCLCWLQQTCHNINKDICDTEALPDYLQIQFSTLSLTFHASRCSSPGMTPFPDAVISILKLLPTHFYLTFTFLSYQFQAHCWNTTYTRIIHLYSYLMTVFATWTLAFLQNTIKISFCLVTSISLDWKTQWYYSVTIDSSVRIRRHAIFLTAGVQILVGTKDFSPVPRLALTWPPTHFSTCGESGG